MTPSKELLLRTFADRARVAYHHALTAAEQATATMDTLLADLCIPGEPNALARALQKHQRRSSLAGTPCGPVLLNLLRR